MTKFLRLTPVVLLGLWLFAFQPINSKAQSSPAVVSGKVLVKFAPGKEPNLSMVKVGRKNGFIQTGIAGFDILAARHQATAIRPVFPSNPRKEEAHRRHGLHLWYELTIPQDRDANAVALDFKKAEGVLYAEPVQAKTMIEPGKPKLVTNAPLSSITSPVNDPFFYLQWHYENDGKTNGGIAEADINLLEAWKTQSGSPNVIVSVHDLGVDVTHKDLASNIWINIAEKNGKPGVDDDYNGYVDDINGYDFSGNTGNVPAGDHATHVAGTIAAVNNNGIGVCGIAGGDPTHPGVKIMTAKILNGMYDNTPASYVYAADNGAVISQNSWGYTAPGVYDQAVLDAIDYFIEEAGNYPNSPMKGGIVIFAAGNSNSDMDFWPGVYDKVMSVASLGRTNQRAYYSNYGATVDIAAPGGDQYNASEDGVLSTLPNNQYGFYQGTSMACPHVSGVAALVVSQYGGKGYTAQDLWTALLTGTHDIDQYNPDFAGQLGVGYLDAALALKKNGKIAPSKLSDLQVNEAGQDYIALSWSAASDTDDGAASRYQIYFGTDSLDVAKQQGKSAIVNSSAAAGETVTKALPDLFASTTYFIAGVAIDRWGNRSALSTVLSATTTDGPSVTLDKSNIDFSIDVKQGTTAIDNFNIVNGASGELRWKGEVRQVDYQLDWNKVTYPVANPSFNGKATTGMHRSTARMPKQKATTLGYNDDYQQRAISYVYDEWNAYMIGEEDTSIPNSAATRYKVEYADGFNMTHIDMLLNNNSERGDPPFVVEVYRGEELERKNLIYTEQYSGYTNYDNVYTIQLDHQLFFAAGETFWVAVHMPAGHKYPLGIGEESRSDYSDNCFMSFDVGKNWVPVSTAIGYDFYAWVMVPISVSPGLDQYLTLAPAAGTTPGQDQSMIDVTADATKLINGTYYADIVMLNNDYNNSLAKMPVTIAVTGQKPKLQSDAVVNLGSIFAGTSAETTIALKNVGYGNFTVSSASIDNGAFEITDQPSSVSALGQASIKVKFNAAAAGSYTGVLTLADDKGNKHVVNLAGVSVAPSQINVTPASANYTLNLGQTGHGKFTISNTGAYPLQFFAPKYSSGEGVSYVNKGFNSFGYSYRTSTDGSGLTYTWEDISGTGTEVGSFFKDVINNHFYPVKLGFDFPIFNKTTDQLMITRFGMLTLDDQVNVVGNLIDIGNPYYPYGFISALNQNMTLDGGGKIYYQAKSGHFVVQYENVASMYDENERYTFQVILYDDGNVLINYKDLSTVNDFDMDYIEVAIEDPEKISGYLISNYENPLHASSNFSVEILSPGRSMLSNLSATEGTLAVGESMDITYDVNTTDLTEGTFWQNLVLISNDPATPASTFRVNVTAKGGVADVAMATDSLDMGEIFIGDSAQAVVQIRNNGTKSATIKRIVLVHNYYKIKYDALPFTLKPKSSAYITVKLLGTKVADLYDDVRVQLSTNVVYSTIVHVSVVAPPAISLTYDPINDVLASGESKAHTIDIKNTGASPLQVVPSGPSWAYAVDNMAPGSAGMQYPKNTYFWSKNADVGGPVYQWEEIADKKNKLDFAFDIFTSEEKAVTLPFNFTFYGKSYNTLYVNPKGFVSFTGGQQAGVFPSSTLPDPEVPNNLIAPYWGPGAYYNLDNDVWGVYVKTSEEVVIVEYVYVYNVFGMGDPWNYQVMIYPNGNIKFQYQFPFNGFSSVNNGIIGLENEDGSEGVRIAAYQPFIEDKMAVLLTPANRVDIEPGESKTITINVDAHNMIAGDYAADFLLRTNVPKSISVKVPMTLTVTGAAQVSLSDSLDFGNVIAGEQDGAPKTYSREFTISNQGAASLDISAMSLKSGANFSLWWEVSDWFGTYWDVVPQDLYLSLMPKVGQKFKIDVTPDAGDYQLNDTLQITSNDPTGVVTVPVHAHVMLPAVMNIDKQEVVFMAPDKTYTGSESIVIDNVGGQSDLNYSLSISYQRTGTTTSNVAPSAPKGYIPKVEAVENTTPSMGTMGVEGYNRTLEYSEKNEQDKLIGFGIGGSFISGTKFVAPSDGFTLSSIQTYYASESLTSSTIRATVWVGESISSAVLLYQKNYDLSVSKDFKGNIVLDLDEPLTFFAGETFFIVLHYPFGTSHPQGCVYLDQSIRGTFLYYVEDIDHWFDINDTPAFYTISWLVKALEKDYVDGNWLTLEAQPSGVIAPDASETIQLNAKAANASAIDMYATVHLTSNAPDHSDENVRVNLHINQAPQFIADDYSVWVDEMDSLTLDVPVTDLEDDTYAVTIPNAPSGMTFKQTETGLTLTYRPDYLAAGIHEVAVHATDAGNHESIKPITIAVYNTNRPPVVVDSTARHFDQGSGAIEIETASIVSDPDTDDVLSVSVMSSDVDVAEVLASADKLRIKPKKAGQAVMTLQVTDPYGAKVTTHVTLSVDLVTAVEAPGLGEVKIYPNPATSSVNISLENTATNVDGVQILDITGKVVQLVSVKGRMIRADVTSLAPGLYLIRMNAGSVSHTFKFIKR